MNEKPGEELKEEPQAARRPKRSSDSGPGVGPVGRAHVKGTPRGEDVPT